MASVRLGRVALARIRCWLARSLPEPRFSPALGHKPYRSAPPDSPARPCKSRTRSLRTRGTNPGRSWRRRLADGGRHRAVPARLPAGRPGRTSPAISAARWGPGSTGGKTNGYTSDLRRLGGFLAPAPGAAVRIAAVNEMFTDRSYETAPSQVAVAAREDHRREKSR